MSAYQIAAVARTALVELATPTGRCDRKGLLVAAVLLLTAQIAQAATMIQLSMAHHHPLAIVSTAALLWFSTTAVAKRLHDLSLSAWRLLWAALGIVLWSVAVSIAVLAVFGPQGIEPGQTGYWVTIAATMLPVLAMTVWLHFAKGAEGDNAYGPAPTGSGFSRWPAGGPQLAAAAVAH